tara:strand:+ start:144 stop:449 length:306 start_codon:yes stop_codon:yes gene_type:complete
MSHYDKLPENIITKIGHYIPYKRPLLIHHIEYKIFLQYWKNQCNAEQWTGIKNDLYYTSQEIPFLNDAFFRHQDLRQFYIFRYSTEKGITWRRNKTRRNSI